MKKLAILVAALSTQFASVASAGPLLVDQSTKTLSTTNVRSAAADPICICSFDPETGKWTCIPRGCWVVPKDPNVGLDGREHTLTLPKPDYSLPSKTLIR